MIRENGALKCQQRKGCFYKYLKIVLEMDKTPLNSDDSGYNSSSLSSSVKRNSNETSSKSRKRKLEPVQHKPRKLSNISEERQSPVGYTNFGNDSCFEDENQLSSSLKKCSLVEEFHSTEKSNSEPTTPQKNQFSDCSLRKYSSLDLTPKKERLELLYPKIHKVYSPEKVRSEIRKLSKQRKRLFHCRDFVYIFSQVEKVDHIISRIFSFLSDADLINVTKVSKLWKKTLQTDQFSYKRYKVHLENITIRKENIYADNNRKKLSHTCCATGRVTVSPTRVNWAQFASAGAVLDKAERLVKCVICERPALLKRGIARCSGLSCGYLWCVGCLAGARSQEMIDCSCKTPHSPPSPLHDKSNQIEDSSLIQEGPSGYFEPEKAKHHVLTDFNDNVTRKYGHTSTNNFNIVEHRDKIYKAKKTLSSRRNKATEPSGSPPHLKICVAGSKESKRNLRRLLF